MRQEKLKSVPPVSQVEMMQGPLAILLRDGGLYPVFQPIVQLGDTSIYAHEALIRGPQGSTLHTPDALLRAAADEGLGYEFEIACIRVIMQAWAKNGVSGRLFINLSASALTRLFALRGRDALLTMIADLGMVPRMLVLEITEHERVEDMDHLAQVVADVRSVGVALALDDFGDGRSSLRLWSQIQPEVVKIDKYFTRQLSTCGNKLKTIQSLQQIATIFGTQLVAEGIETPEDLRVLRDMGIHFGQGYFLGRPERTALPFLDGEAYRVLNEREITVYPELTRAVATGRLRSFSLVKAPTATFDTTNDELAATFLALPSLHAVALLQEERPTAIISRVQFMNEYTKLYYREVWGRKSCAVHANREPRLIEREHSVDDLVGILTSQDQRYLVDGFIATENGRYIGLGTGDQLVRSVTETRIEAARHANPLTFLPGNIPISQHIERLLKKQVRFVACYADLNHFKPFNDQYGYWRGDEMIRMVARIAMDQCDSQRDFLGHVGGDDFILLFQSEDWRVRCERLVAQCAIHAKALFDEDAQRAGGIHAEDRHGISRFFPCTTISIGAVVVEGGQFSRAEDVANVAASAKHAAKQAGVGVFQRSGLMAEAA